MEPRKTLPKDRQPFSNAALKAMIVPLVIEQVLQMVVGLADTMMVSHAGEAVVAGVGLDTMVYTIFIYLFTAVSAGGAVVVSQYIGSRNRDQAELAASQIFHMSGLLSLTCMVLMLLFGSSLLEAMYPETEAATMEACKTYMWIVSLSFPANAVYNAGAAIYRAKGIRNRHAQPMSQQMIFRLARSRNHVDYPSADIMKRTQRECKHVFPNHGTHGRHGNVLGLKSNAFDICAWIVAEVNEKTELHASCLKIVLKLRTVLW